MNWVLTNVSQTCLLQLNYMIFFFKVEQLNISSGVPSSSQQATSVPNATNNDQAPNTGNDFSFVQWAFPFCIKS